MDAKVIAKRLRNALTRRRRQKNDADKGPAYEAQVQMGDWNRAWKIVPNKKSPADVLATGEGRFVIVPRRDRQANSSKYDPRECRARGCR